MIPENAVELVTKWEGFHKRTPEGRAKPYLCPAGFWTIGYGSTRHFDGSRIVETTPEIDEPVAKELMKLELGACVTNLLKVSPILSFEENKERLGALASFVYNLGIGAYNRSTLKKKVNQGDWESARKEILKWVYGGGVRLKGLMLRRHDEARYL